MPTSCACVVSSSSLSSLFFFRLHLGRTVERIRARSGGEARLRLKRLRLRFASCSSSLSSSPSTADLFFDGYADLLRAAPSGAIQAWGPFGVGHVVTTGSPADVDHLLRVGGTASTTTGMPPTCCHGSWQPWTRRTAASSAPYSPLRKPSAGSCGERWQAAGARAAGGRGRAVVGVARAKR